MSWTTATHITIQASACGAFAGGIAMLSYLNYANARGWPSGNLYATGKGSTIGMGACIMAMVIATTSSWWGLLIVPVVGFFIGYIITMAFASMTQVIAPLLFTVSIIAGLFCANMVR